MAYINGNEIFFSSIVNIKEGDTIVVECDLDHVIDVTELPTENIDTSAIYRCDGLLYQNVDGEWVKYSSAPEYIEGNLPVPVEGDDGKIIEVADGAYTLTDVKSSTVMTYLKSITPEAIDENSTDEQYASAKAVYTLFDKYIGQINTRLDSLVNGEGGTS